MNQDKIKKTAMLLFKKSGTESDIKEINSIHQGGNNSLHHIKCNQKEFILKLFFNSPAENNNRLISEFNFLNYANQFVGHSVPKLLAIDNNNSSALYEFIEGKKIQKSTEITDNHIKQAANFIYLLNQNKKNAKNIQIATEACFTIKDHLIIVDNRINDFKNNLKGDTKFSEIIEILNYKWSIIKKEILNKISFYNLPLNKPLEIEKRIISPSDFGFHNALVKKDGAMVFLDFEYSGWDDPAKLVGDFFCQVEIPVNNIFIDIFINNAFTSLELNEVDLIRIKTLLAVYKIKWCCIVLNVFSLKNLNRRLFSNPNLNLNIYKDGQLNKAKILLESM